jgi:hypothetical protein
MSDSILVYEPVAPCLTPQREPRGSLESLRGKTVGFIDNSKPNFHHLVDDLAELLVTEYGVANVVKRRKHSASIPAPEPVVADLVAQCDAVITGSGD